MTIQAHTLVWHRALHQNVCDLYCEVMIKPLCRYSGTIINFYSDVQREKLKLNLFYCRHCNDDVLEREMENDSVWQAEVINSN